MLLKIDELLRGDHHYLSDDDACYYFVDYTAGAGYGFSDANNLIHNFKKPTTYKGQAPWHYKNAAISRIAGLFRDHLSGIIDFNACTLVPIPGSKTKSNPAYDDRMVRTLQLYTRDTAADLRELIVLKKDRDASHASGSRPGPRAIRSLLALDPALGDGLEDTVVLFDDVLTTGAHFVACKQLIRQAYPDKQVMGIFVARTIHQPPALDFDAFDFSDRLG